MFPTRTPRIPRRRDDDGRVAVIGLGRFGSALATTLAEQGIEVLAIDSSPKRVEAVSDRLAHCVVADSSDREAMDQIGIAEFSHVVVAIGTDIESSVLTCSLLDEIGITDIWAKAITEQHARILRRVGAHHVVSPEAETGRRVAHLVTGYLVDFQTISGDLAIAEIAVPPSLQQEPLHDCALVERFGVHLMAVRHAGGELESVRDTVQLGAGDRILVWGVPDALRAMAAEVRRSN